MLLDLGFDFTTFSYPRRKPLGSSSLVCGNYSALVDFDSEEFDFESIKRLKKRFPILNPFDSLKRHAATCPWRCRNMSCYLVAILQ